MDGTPGFNTRALHSGGGGFASGATLPPVFQVSAFAHESMERLEQVFAYRKPGFVYTRVGNPTVAAFENRVNALEGGAGAVACSSGMAAVSQLFLNLLSSGDEVIVSEQLYGGTIQLDAFLSNLGITARAVPRLVPSELCRAVNERTRLVFGEVIGNPGLDVMDIASASGWCRLHGLPLAVDATMATPYLVRPIEFGADFVVHSSSKYLNGSSNGVSGVIVDAGRFRWRSERYPALAKFVRFRNLAALARLRQDTVQSLGGCLAPANAYLNILGIETLGLRMERICANADALARALAERHGLEVNYPTLPGHPSAGLVKRQFGGRGGGILTLRAGSAERAHRIVDSLRYATIASNIGDVRTLVLCPARTLYIHSTAEEMNAAGVFDDTVRVSVGIEDAKDLIDDFNQAIAASAA